MAGIFALAEEYSSVKGKACVHSEALLALASALMLGIATPATICMHGLNSIVSHVATRQAESPSDSEEARTSLRDARKPAFPLPVEELAE